MSIYDRLENSAKRLIDRFTPEGAIDTWYQKRFDVPDSSKPYDRVQLDPQPFPLRIVFIESRDREKEFNFEESLPGLNMQLDNSNCIFYPQGFDPQGEDDDGLEQDYVIRADGSRMTCRYVRSYKPHNKTLLWIARIG